MQNPTIELGPGDALLVVDVQRDFCEDGSLPVPQGDEVVPVLNRWLRAAEHFQIPIYLSRDWHPIGHPSFCARGGEWPRHCIQESEGAAFHPDLYIPARVELVSKGTRFDRDQYSAFDGTGLASELRQRGVRTVWIGGLALDVCVRASAADALDEGFAVNLIVDATRPLDRSAGELTLTELRDRGARLVTER